MRALQPGSRGCHVSPAVRADHATAVDPSGYNIAPRQEILIVVAPPDGAGREVRAMRRCLIPAWAKSPAFRTKVINARAETVATKPAFLVPLRERRCLIVTDGLSTSGRPRGAGSCPGSSGCRTAAPSPLRACGTGGRIQRGGGVESCASSPRPPVASFSGCP